MPSSPPVVEVRSSLLHAGISGDTGTGDDLYVAFAEGPPQICVPFELATVTLFLRQGYGAAASWLREYDSDVALRGVVAALPAAVA